MTQSREALIPQDFIDELLSRTDIVEIIESRVKLKKTGKNHSGLCPFHNEKTPSFSVNGDGQFYHCFGCKASGNALGFLMEYERLDFISAIEMLAARVGLEVPRENQSPQAQAVQKKRKSVYDILQQVSDYYRAQLRSGEGRDQAVTYLKARGVTGQIARDYALGFAPPGWDNLLKELAKTNHEQDLLIEGGMIIDRSEENKTYDRFRERIMFPIRDLRGRVIAFGGRILGDGKPKYLNSPETVVFHKSRELYGLYEARQANKKLEQLLVVEGYMDVVALAQHDVKFAVATLGTATTGEHLERLFRMVSKVVFCFDGDEAGRRAAWKALEISLPHMKDGRSARFLFVPDGEDPDSLIRAEGKDKFLDRVEQSQPLSEFFFAKLSAEVDLDSLDGKAHLSQLAMPMIGQIPMSAYRELMVGELSRLTNLTSEKLLSLARESKPAPEPQVPPKREPQPEIDEGYLDIDIGDSDAEYEDYGDYHDAAPLGYEQPAVLSPMAKKALEMLLVQPELAFEVPPEVLAVLADDAGSVLLENVLKVIIDQDERSPVMILSHFQSSSEFETLKNMAEKEHLLAPEDLRSEFLGTLEVISEANQRLSTEQWQKQLLAKPMSTWTEEEKNQMRSISRKQR